MDEFEAGNKRAKISEANEKTKYAAKDFTSKDKKREKSKPMGGNPINGRSKKPQGKKRDIKDGIKSKNFKHKDESEEDGKYKEKMSELKRFYNQLRIKKGDLKPTREQKLELIDSCLEQLEDDYKKFAFKHDGCRVLQSMLKHGSKEQRSKIIGHLIALFDEMLIYKYSYHL
jgi:vacuolar-type H+-ATPase subunit I/STV1